MIGPTRENVINITYARIEARENWETPLELCACLSIYLLYRGFNTSPQ